MPSDRRAYVWVWLPGATEPVVAGRLDPFTATSPGAPELLDFVYGQSYLERSDAIPLYLPELPLHSGRIRPLAGLAVPGVVADAAPDAWGRRVVLRRLTGQAARDAEAVVLGEVMYLLESGSERAGALDFQSSATVYEARGGGTLEQLVEAAASVDGAKELAPALRDALFAGSSLGGARPKVTVTDGDRRLVVKLSSPVDTYPVVRAEALAMDLAFRAGIDVAPSGLGERLCGRDLLFVERFDRPPEGGRRMVVSALTLLGLPEYAARHATYHELADVVVDRCTSPTETLQELFRRIVFNICIGNTDDHARNHAAFWHPPARAAATDGPHLTLAPAYDLCPQARTGGEAVQAMAIGRDGFRMSQLAGCVERAELYRLTSRQAREIIDHQLDVIQRDFSDAAEAARLTKADRDFLWGRQILNPYALEGYR